MKIGIDNGDNWTAEYYEATVVSVVDYYPFGSSMAGRKYNQGSYRYGFNGMEKDDEVKGEGNSYTTHYRLLDTRIGRWYSRDPVVRAYYSSYQSMGNNPILKIDPKGNIEYIDVDGNLIANDGNNEDQRVYVITNEETANYVRTLIVQFNASDNPDQAKAFIPDLLSTRQGVFVLPSLESRNEQREQIQEGIRNGHLSDGELGWAGTGSNQYRLQDNGNTIDGFRVHEVEEVAEDDIYVNDGEIVIPIMEAHKGWFHVHVHGSINEGYQQGPSNIDYLFGTSGGADFYMISYENQTVFLFDEYTPDNYVQKLRMSASDNQVRIQRMLPGEFEASQYGSYDGTMSLDLYYNYEYGDAAAAADDD